MSEVKNVPHGAFQVQKELDLNWKSPLLLSSFFIYCFHGAPGSASLWPPASFLHQPGHLSHTLDPVPGYLAEPGVHGTYYSRHPVIYFSSELIAKSIWSREKTSTQACHEKQGNRGSFLSQPVQPGEAGGGRCCRT